MVFVWTIVSVIGSAVLALWAHDRYYSYKYAALSQRLRRKSEDGSGALIAMIAD